MPHSLRVRLKNLQRKGELTEKDIDRIFKALEQEQKTGHWIYDRTRDWDGECKYECSECCMGSDVDFAYCMRCGARMIEPQEGSGEECN